MLECIAAITNVPLQLSGPEKMGAQALVHWQHKVGLVVVDEVIVMYACCLVYVYQLHRIQVEEYNSYRSTQSLCFLAWSIHIHHKFQLLYVQSVCAVSLSHVHYRCMRERDKIVGH